MSGRGSAWLWSKVCALSMQHDVEVADVFDPVYEWQPVAVDQLWAQPDVSLGCQMHELLLVSLTIDDLSEWNIHDNRAALCSPALLLDE